MFCNRCGQEIDEGLTICPNCGAKQEQPEVREDPNYDAVMRKGAAHMGVSLGRAIELYFGIYRNWNVFSFNQFFYLVYCRSFVFNLIIYLPQLIISKHLPIFSLLITLGLFVPQLSLEIRRLHDIGKEWYWMFMSLIPLAGPIIILIFMCTESDTDNRWGYGPEHR